MRVQFNPHDDQQDICDKRDHTDDETTKKQCTDRLARDNAIQDHQDRGRDKRTDGARSSDSSRCEFRAVPVAHHLWHGDFTHRGGTGDRRTGHSSKARATKYRRNGKTTRQTRKPYLCGVK